jgi:hypothetical protein
VNDVNYWARKILKWMSNNLITVIGKVPEITDVTVRLQKLMIDRTSREDLWRAKMISFTGVVVYRMRVGGERAFISTSTFKVFVKKSTPSLTLDDERMNIIPHPHVGLRCGLRR